MVLSLLKKYHAKRAILFDSSFRQEAVASSDIDLIIVGGKNFEPNDVLCVAEELYTKLNKSVEVFELREINPDSAFYDAIIGENVQIT